MEISDQIKLAQIDLLNEVDRICKKNNINYFLAYGTLLGCIRHNGFIPWDDDIDIGMLRDDYIKFKECCEKELSSEYMLSTWENDEESVLPFYKLKIKDTVYVEGLNTNGTGAIFIDIFKFDYVPDNFFIRNTILIKEWIYRKVYLLKNNYSIVGPNFIDKVKYLPLIFLSKIMSEKYIIQRYKKIDNKKYKGKYLISNAHDNQMKKREYFDANYFNKFESHLFENRYYTIPSSYDMILKKIYGDYMKLPPLEEQKSAHDIKKMDLKSYKIKCINDQKK